MAINKKVSIYLSKGETTMANRFVLNETSYHGKGAISAIVDEATRRGFKKAFLCCGQHGDHSTGWDEHRVSVQGT